jgi:hypothetical protein
MSAALKNLLGNASRLVGIFRSFHFEVGKSWGAVLRRLSVAAYKDFAKARGSGSDLSKLDSGPSVWPSARRTITQRVSLSDGATMAAHRSYRL